MNSINDATSVADTFQSYAYIVVHVSCLALLLYATLLAFHQEVEYIWIKNPSFPNLFYIFARYGPLSTEVFVVWMLFLPVTGSLCNALSIVSDVTQNLAFVGVQGLLAARAYAVCQGNRLIAGCLALLFLGGIVLSTADLALFPGCIPNDSNSSPASRDLVVAWTVCIALTDLLVFGVTLWKVWDTWKLKRGTDVRSNTNSLASILIKQTLTRFCFVCFITVTFSAITYWFVDGAIANTLYFVQNVLSAILIADGLLYLRQQNSATVDIRDASLPSIRFATMLHRIHESIIVELGDHEDVDPRVEGDVDAVAQSGLGVIAAEIDITEPQN